jgi:hypothetical protein
MSVEREIQDFISKVQNRIKTENVFEKIVEDHKSNKCTWDVAAKRRIGRIVEEVFKQCFLVQGDIHTGRHHQIFVEGGGDLPE